MKNIIIIGAVSVSQSVHIMNVLAGMDTDISIVVNAKGGMMQNFMDMERGTSLSSLKFDVTKDYCLEDIPEFEYEKIGDRKQLTSKQRKNRKAKRRQVKQSRNFMHKST